MKVLLAYKPGEMRIVEMEKPVPGPGEILAKVAHCGICATDVAIADGTLTLGDGMDPIYPVRIGHEWSGVVVETGEGTWSETGRSRHQRYRILLRRVRGLPEWRISEL